MGCQVQGKVMCAWGVLMSLHVFQQMKHKMTAVGGLVSEDPFFEGPEQERESER